MRSDVLTTAEEREAIEKRLAKLRREVERLKREKLEDAPPVIRALVRLGEPDEREEDHDG